MIDFVFEGEVYQAVNDPTNNCKGCAFEEDHVGCKAAEENDCLSNHIMFIKKETPEQVPSALEKQEGGKHYKCLVIQPVEYIQANGLDFFQGNVVKYVTRHKGKNGAEDIRKAMHYLQLILELQYEGVETKKEVDK